jgi:peptide/nickel transport system ATP-binding protein
MATGDVLAIDGLSVDFRTTGGRLHALRDVNLSVPAGEIVGIVGESGCGKSTLINAVLGLLAENAEVAGGRVLFKGADLLRMRGDDRRRLLGDRITTIFQDPMTALNPVMSIGTQMTEIQYRSGASASEKRQRAIEFLKKVRIPDAERRLSQYPHQLSGGMRQRVVIAIALACRPPLVIADEPTTALDVTIQAQVLDLLRELKARYNLSLLLITHDFGVIAEMADRVAVMFKGRLVEQGPVRQILRQPQHEYTRGLLAAIPGSALAGERFDQMKARGPAPAKTAETPAPAHRDQDRP